MRTTRVVHTEKERESECYQEIGREAREVDVIVAWIDRQRDRRCRTRQSYDGSGAVYAELPSTVFCLWRHSTILVMQNSTANRINTLHAIYV